MSERLLSPKQPGDGDVILHCGHLNCKKHHFALATSPVKFTRPNGTQGTASWFVVCDWCFRKHGKNIGDVPIKGDAIWQGDKPAIFISEHTGTTHQLPPDQSTR